jgi:hypothetical protein
MLGFASRLEALVRRAQRNWSVLAGVSPLRPTWTPQGGGWAAGAPARAQPPAGAFPTSISISQWRHTAQPPCS